MDFSYSLLGLVGIEGNGVIRREVWAMKKLQQIQESAEQDALYPVFTVHGRKDLLLMLKCLVIAVEKLKAECWCAPGAQCDFCITLDQIERELQ